MDTRWKKVFGHVKNRGKFVNFYLEVQLLDGGIFFRSKTLSAHEIATCRIDMYKFVLDGMARDIQRQIEEHARKA